MFLQPGLHRTDPGEAVRTEVTAGLRGDGLTQCSALDLKVENKQALSRMVGIKGNASSWRAEDGEDRGRTQSVGKVVWG